MADEAVEANQPTPKSEHPEVRPKPPDSELAAPVVEEQPKLSRNAIKRQRRLAKIAEKNKMKRLVEKEKKRCKREERHAAFTQHLASLPDDETRQSATQTLKDKARLERQTKRETKQRVHSAIHSSTTFVCVDCGWNADMTEKEIKSLVKQLGHAYASVSKTVASGGRPFRLAINGFDSILEKHFQTVAPGWKQWPLKFDPLDLADSEWKTKRAPDLVYLTSDSDTVLEELRENEIYIIGGIVDRNRMKFATQTKAKKLGIRTARLKLESEVSLSNSTPVLTVNHVVEILAEVYNGSSWADALLRVLPQRKGAERLET